MADEEKDFRSYWITGLTAEMSLNPHTVLEPDRDDQPLERGSLVTLKRIINDYQDKGVRKVHLGTWRAICLHSKIEYYKATEYPNFSLKSELGEDIAVVAVVARIPELDALRAPWPDTLADDLNVLKIDDLEWLNQHRVYRWPLHGRYGVTTIPAPGDIVEVDFEDRTNRQFPIYVGLIEKGPGIISDATDTSTESEPETAFENSASAPTTIGENSESQSQQQEQEQIEQMEDETKTAVDDMASDYAAATGVSDEDAKKIVEEHLGEQGVSI